jgi:hypothetical protein
VGCGRCGGVGSLLTFDIPQTALVATLDTYDFIFESHIHCSSCKDLFWNFVSNNFYYLLVRVNQEGKDTVLGHYTVLHFELAHISVSLINLQPG